MPTTLVPNSNMEFSVYNDIYYKIIKDVCESIELDPSIAKIMFKGIEQTPINSATNVSIREDDGKPKTSSYKRVVVRINQSYDEENINTTPVYQNEYLPIFHDKELGVSVSPMYIQMEAELEFTYTSPSKSELSRIRDSIRIHLSNMRDIGHHEVEYTTFINNNVIEFLETVYDMRNRLAPIDMAEWFTKCSSNRIHLLTDMSNKGNARLGVRERQTRIIGRYDFSPAPAGSETDRDTNTHSFTFTYSFNFSVPRALVLRYPLMICNMMLPEKYWRDLEEQARREYDKRNSQALHIGHAYNNLSIFESQRLLENKVNINLPRKEPMCDDFDNKQGHKGYGIALSLLIEVDEDDKVSLFNLNDLGDHHLGSIHLDYIREQGRNEVTIPYRSHIYMGLWQGNRYFDSSLIEIDEDLNVRSKVELSLFSPVRVTFSINIDMTNLRNEHISYMQKHPVLYIEFLKDHLEARKNYTTLLRGREAGINNLVEEIFLFLLVLINTDEHEHILNTMGTILEGSPMVAEIIATELQTKKRNMLNYLTHLGISITGSGSGRYSYTVRTEQQDPKGSSNQPNILG